jgi:vancomycin permeability regulator SanA
VGGRLVFIRVSRVFDKEAYTLISARFHSGAELSKVPAVASSFGAIADGVALRWSE